MRAKKPVLARSWCVSSGPLAKVQPVISFLAL
jgi:hypothetical protein